MEISASGGLSTPYPQKKMKKINLLLFIVLSITVNCFAVNDTTKTKKLTEISFSDGIEKGYFTYEFIGAYDPRIFEEFIDKEGVHYGKCMALILESKIDSLILLRIEPGRLLIPIDTTIQVMIITKTAIIPLYPNSQYATRLYAMCSEIHKYSPMVNTSFTYGDMADTGLVKLSKHIESTFMQNMIGQHAIWAYANQAKIEELSKYGADSLTLELTRKLLDHVNLETEINKQVLIDEKSDTVEINKTILIIVSSSLLLIILVLTYFSIKKVKRKKEKV